MSCSKFCHEPCPTTNHIFLGVGWQHFIIFKSRYPGRKCNRMDLDTSVDVLPPIACHGGPRGSIVRASAYAELDGERKRQSIYPGSGPRS